MHCPRCGRSLLALARRPAAWSESAPRGQWFGVHAGDVNGSSGCRLAHDEAIALSAGAQPQPQLVETPVWRRAA